ncbi:LPS export ABC transporter periplasmic protein LptC [uncultured Bacteroides sp.]|uniref:LPS export ABC transporter periplasmic protein LptC n=1 Tax=uncultured Bacteroides sp. TaxID=162156 RepID=UPI002AAAE312|nr:LPS export ABC transporter periplasmic protein LptC [uncultured Bacteroides sp.]
MWLKRNKCLFHKTVSITVALIATVMLLLFSCSGREKQLAKAITERDSLPMMETLGVTTLISDSGIIRYRVKTPEWLIFDKKRPSYWAFEKGVYLEKFDSLLHVDASISADTAYYYDKKKLWKLIGHVAIKNLQGDKFNTELLYWNQATGKVYSEKFIRIEQPDKVILGHGFDSNQQMTVYNIHNIEGVFYIDEQEASVKNDSLK